MAITRHERRIVFRDLMIFQLKLVLDGMKDVVLVPLSVAAALSDVVFPSDRIGKRFYHVLRAGERFDRWLSLFGAAEHADAGEDGLFGRSRAGSDTLLGKLEEMAIGREEPK